MPAFDLLYDDILEQVLKIDLKIPNEGELASDREKWRELKEAYKAMSAWEPVDAAQPSTPDDIRERLQRAIDMTVLDSRFYRILQRILFSTLYVDDTMDSSALADRLELPLFNMLGINSPTAGSFVTRLEITTKNPSIRAQNDVMRILAACTNLRCLTYSNFSSDEEHELRPWSPFVKQFIASTRWMARSLRFLSLSLNMDATACQDIVNGIGRMAELRVLLIYGKFPFRGGTSIFITRRSLPKLHTIGIDCSWGSAYPFLASFAFWNLAALVTLLTTGLDALRGVSEFMDSPASLTLRDLKTELPCMFGELVWLRFDRLINIMFSWRTTVFLLPCESVQVAYMMGTIDDTELEEFEYWDAVMMTRIVEQLSDRRKFPKLESVFMLDVELSELVKLPWAKIMSEAWILWCDMLIKSNVKFFDAKGERMDGIIDGILNREDEDESILPPGFHEIIPVANVIVIGAI